MSVLNDDGVPMDLSAVLILFLMPNLILILLTISNVYLLRVSKKHPRLNRTLGKLANFFAKGALDRIIRNILEYLEMQKRQHEENIPMTHQSLLSVHKIPRITKKLTVSSSLDSMCEKKFDANYLLLVPFQIELLVTVFVYKILTRDVYFETCQSYLTTYHDRPNQVICWLKNTNKNITNASLNITLHQYCTNQTITYINYEHNDVMCTQYVLRLINIIDTVTNMFAWHQAVVFLVTKYIIFSHWYQQKLRKSFCWSNHFAYQCRIILAILISFALSSYIILFVFILPIRFALMERHRVDLTHHLLYACSKFIVGIIVHVNLYTIYQWYSLIRDKKRASTAREGQKLACRLSVVSNRSAGHSVYASPRNSIVMNDSVGSTLRKYLTPITAV